MRQKYGNLSKKTLGNTDLNEPKMNLTVVSETIINIEMYVQFEVGRIWQDESKAFCHRFCRIVTCKKGS
jgi:hypothetical protein